MKAKINNFLFTPVNPKTIIVFRVLMALMLAFVFAPRNLDPIFPLTKIPEIAPYFFSLEYYILIYLLILLFALGVKPRIIAFILFLILFPHDFLSEGRKSKQVLLTVLLCFSFIKSLPIKYLFNCDILKEHTGPIWPVRLIQFQLTMVYGINAIAKTTYYYLSGEALSNMTVVMEQFQIDLSDGNLYLNTLVIPAYVLGVTSVLIEYWLSIGFWWRKTKWLTAVIGVLFHISLTFTLSIFMLDYVSVFLYLSFLLPFKLKFQNANQHLKF